MTFKCLRQLVATLSLVLFVPGGASAAPARSEAAARAGTAPAAAAAGRRQRRVEDAWLGEQRHVARRGTTRR